MKTKILLLSILISISVMAQNITNTLGTSGLFKIKDASTDYLTLSQSTGQVNILRSLRLENTSSSAIGVLYKGAERFLHNFGGDNLFLGLNSGNFTLTGFRNSAFGNSTLYSNTTGNDNSAFGNFTLYSNTTGYRNSAFGGYSLYFNTTGYRNSAFGYYSLLYNTTGYDNSAFGYYSLYSNTTGYDNSAFGNSALFSNTTGFRNSAFGDYSLYYNTTGNWNSVFGFYSLLNNTTGYDNSAFGYYSLYSNTTGYANSAFGEYSLESNTTGTYNTALGYNSGSTITTGSNLTCIGYNAQPTSNSVSNQITLGNFSITSLRCNVTTITSLSDARDKKNISNIPLGLDFLMKVKPRQFNWDKREWYDDKISDGSKMQEKPTAGFIAQELDEVQNSENAEWLNLVLKDNPDKWEATPGNLLPIMVKAIQDLKAENDLLKEQIESLKKVEERVAVLEKIISEQNQGKEIKSAEK
ncbi:MAG TPA: tail fiber domain-containing protein [Ignavibacteria bacterium]|jgi:hypothetical protein